MSETHTPLPWEAIGTGFELRIVDANATPICESLAWNDQGEANAEFIVRACNSYHDLLYALDGLLDTIEWPPDSNCSCHICAPCNDCVDYAGLRESIAEAKAAIQKAKQRQP